MLFGFDYDVFAFNYNIRMKGHYTQNWTYLYLTEDVPTRSESESTVLSYALVDKNVNSYILGDKMQEFPPSGAESKCLNSKIIYNRYLHLLKMRRSHYIFLSPKAEFSDSVAVLGK